MKSPEPPRGWSRLLFRLPIWLYRARLGWLLGGRFLLLSHLGRRSGLPRQAVLEVAGHDTVSNAYLVASGWGDSSDWYQNLNKEPDVSIQVGNRRFQVRAEFLSPEESGEALVEYAQRHPGAARNLASFLGYEIDGSEAGYRQAGRELIPFVRFVPRT